MMLLHMMKVISTIHSLETPYDVLNEIKDDIGTILTVKISPTINEQFCNVTLNDVLENGVDVETALQTAQDVIALEQ